MFPLAADVGTARLLTHLPDLESLSLKASGVKGDFLKSRLRNARLQSLSLQKCDRIGRLLLPPGSCTLPLRSLCLSHSSNLVTVNLASLPALIHLDLSYCPSLQSVTLTTPGLQELVLRGSSKLESLSLDHDGPAPALTTLDLMLCRGLPLAMLSRLVSSVHQSLVHLSLCGCYVVPDDMPWRLVREARTLRSLDLAGCKRVTKDSLQRVQSELEYRRGLDRRSPQQGLA